MRRINALFIFWFIGCLAPCLADEEPVSAIARRIPEMKSFDPITAVGDEFTPEFSQQWLNHWKANADVSDPPIDAALGIYVQSRLPDEIRQEALMTCFMFFGQSSGLFWRVPGEPADVETAV